MHISFIDYKLLLSVAGKIASVFDSLRAEAPVELAELLDYMNRNWIRGKFWTPEN
jgi:hypothetical protein